MWSNLYIYVPFHVSFLLCICYIFFTVFCNYHFLSIPFNSFFCLFHFSCFISFLSFSFFTMFLVVSFLPVPFSFTFISVHFFLPLLSWTVLVDVFSYLPTSPISSCNSALSSCFIVFFFNFAKYFITILSALWHFSSV